MMKTGNASLRYPKGWEFIAVLYLLYLRGPGNIPVSGSCEGLPR